MKSNPVVTRYTDYSDIPPELGLEDVAIDNVATLIHCHWPDRNGYYFQMDDGSFCVNVYNESEAFANEHETQAWLYSRIDANS